MFQIDEKFYKLIKLFIENSRIFIYREIFGRHLSYI